MAIFMMSAAVPWMGALIGFAFFAVLQLLVEFALQGREVATASEKRFNVPLLCRQLTDAIELFLHAGEF